MAQSHTSPACVQIARSPSVAGGGVGCPTVPFAQADGQGAIVVIDHSWGLPGLGPDGTLALGAMAIAAATVSTIAWRALAPARVRSH